MLLDIKYFRTKIRVYIFLLLDEILETNALNLNRENCGSHGGN